MYSPGIWCHMHCMTLYSNQTYYFHLSFHFSFSKHVSKPNPIPAPRSKSCMSSHIRHWWILRSNLNRYQLPKWFGVCRRITLIWDVCRTASRSSPCALLRWGLTSFHNKSGKRYICITLHWWRPGRGIATSRPRASRFIWKFQARGSNPKPECYV